eukprot:m.344891 g.344891  ORF g.344891 m.344891 type:complete len:383 (-) comp25376_c0_seq1:30-1178(-)
MALTMTLLVYIAASLVSAQEIKNNEQDSKRNIFGMGVYNDTNAPPISLQLPVAKEVAGDSGSVLIFGNLIFSRDGDPTSRLPFDSWVVDALKQAYDLKMRPILRLGQWPRTIRNFASDEKHTNYTTLAEEYALVVQSVVSAVNITPMASKLRVLLLNEPNVCGEWQCSEGCGHFIPDTEIAVEVANCLNAMKIAVNNLPQHIRSLIEVAVAPISQLGFSECECCYQNQTKKIPQNQTGVNFIKKMLNTNGVPTLYDNIDFFSSHCYPWGDGPYPGNPIATHGLTVYRDQANIIGLSDNIPIAITETGWRNQGQEAKANWTSNMFTELYGKDKQVDTVTPFLLASNTYAPLAWTLWNGSSLIEKYPLFNATIQARCSMGMGGC